MRYCIILFMFLLSCNSSETPENKAPQAFGQAISTGQGTPVDIFVEGKDADGDKLTIKVEQNPSHGQITISNLTIRYSPNPDFSGLDIIKVSLSDGKATSNIATIAITVNRGNSLPTLATSFFSVLENTITDINLEVEDLDNDPLTYEMTAHPQNGTITGAFPNLRYQGNPNFYGSDSFGFRVSDGIGESNFIVGIIVQEVDNSPIFTITSYDIQEDTPTAITLQATDESTLSYTIITQPNNGVLSGTAPNLTYTPNSNYHGTDSFQVSASDRVNQTTQTISLVIHAVNDAPTADSFTLSINEDTNTVMPLAGHDVDEDSLTFEISTPPNNATIVFEGGNWVLKPEENFNGQIVFGYKAFDGELRSAEATATINVQPVNDAPIASAVVKSGIQNVPMTFNIPVQDAEGGPITIEILEAPKGTLSINETLITYTPQTDFIGYDGFLFRAKDAQGATSTPVYADITVVSATPGKRWHNVSLPITIKVPTGIDSGRLLALFSVKDKWNEALGQTAIIMEQDTPNQQYTGIYDSLDDMIYAITFQYDSWFSGYDTTLAITLTRTYGTTIVNADILFNYFSYPFDTQTPVPSDRMDFESILLHEMGHLLGLSHISVQDDPASTMNPTFGFGEMKRELSIYDYQAIRNKYSLPPLNNLPPNTNLNYQELEGVVHGIECQSANIQLD